MGNVTCLTAQSYSYLLRSQSHSVQRVYSRYVGIRVQTWLLYICLNQHMKFLLELTYDNSVVSFVLLLRGMENHHPNSEKRYSEDFHGIPELDFIITLNAIQTDKSTHAITHLREIWHNEWREEVNWDCHKSSLKAVNSARTHYSRLTAAWYPPRGHQERLKPDPYTYSEVEHKGWVKKKILRVWSESLAIKPAKRINCGLCARVLMGDPASSYWWQFLIHSSPNCQICKWTVWNKHDVSIPFHGIFCWRFKLICLFWF